MSTKLTKKRVVQISIIIGVVILPLLYSYFYLGAFWDPYSTLDTLPVAVVNQDQGAVINDKERNLGEELCKELQEDDSLKFVVTDETDAKKGTEGKDYYAMIVVPTNFSANIASSSEEEKTTATITFSSNEKKNYLASQILSRATLQIEENLRSNVNKEITAELSTKLEDVPEQLGELQNGLNKLNNGSSDLTGGTSQLKDGTAKLTDGASDLAEGTNEFSSKFADYQAGVTNAKTGASSLSKGASSLDTGIDGLLTSATALENSTKSLTDLQKGAKDLADGASLFNSSLITYTSGVDSLIKNVTDTTTFLTQYVTANPSLMKDPTFNAFITKMSNPELQKNIKDLSDATTSLKTASATISAGISQLSTGTNNLPQLQAGIAAIKQGLAQAKTGSSQLANGSITLDDGLSALSQATEKLNAASKDIKSGAAAVSTGASTVNDGANDLNEGAEKLQQGIATAKDGVDTSIITANEQLKSLDGLDEFASEPVTIQSESINAVPNYGTAFAPYFLSLSLWVGAIIIFVGIFLDSDNKFKVLSRYSDKKVLRTFIYLLIGFAQAVILAIVLKLCLGLQVNHLGLYFVSCCLVSIVFISIVQFLMVFLKDAGKFLSLLLLILQLTSCGGTFPMETVPKFFNVLYPFMPMTYSVNLFKEAISGGDISNIWFNVFVLVSILIVFVSLTIVFSKVKISKAESKAALA